MFLISKKTLVDQGKDVSRALRNRCLQIDVDYLSNGSSDISTTHLDKNYDSEFKHSVESMFELVN
jgi:hypothetical protein